MDNFGRSLLPGDKYLRLRNGRRRSLEEIAFRVLFYFGIRVACAGGHKVGGKFTLKLLPGGLPAEHLMKVLPAHEERLMMGDAALALRHP